MINTRHTNFFFECIVESRKNPAIKQFLAEMFDIFRASAISLFSKVSAFDFLSDEEKAVLSSLIVAIHEGLELQWFISPEKINTSAALEMVINMLALVSTDENFINTLRKHHEVEKKGKLWRKKK